MVDMGQLDRTLRANTQAAEKAYAIVNIKTGKVVSHHKCHGDAIRAVMRASIDEHRIESIKK